jgi:two-component system sensor histidine kinase BaeS
LAISKAIVEAHGGEIVVRSTQGEGTTFTVRLPARAMPPHGQEIPERS